MARRCTSFRIWDLGSRSKELRFRIEGFEGLGFKLQLVAGAVWIKYSASAADLAGPGGAPTRLKIAALIIRIGFWGQYV